MHHQFAVIRYVSNNGLSFFNQVELNNGAGTFKSDAFRIRTLDGSKQSTHRLKLAYAL